MANRRSNNGYSDSLYYLGNPNVLESDPQSTWNDYGANNSIISQIPIFGKFMDMGVGQWLNAYLGDNAFDDNARQRQLSTDQQRLAIQLARENNANELLSTYMANIMEKENADRYNANQLLLQDRANQFNVEQWNRANEYNSPKEIMKRYAEIGVNPNFVFGVTSNVQPVTQQGVPDQSRAGVAKANFRPAEVVSPGSRSGYNSMSSMADMIKGLISSLPQSVLAAAQARKTNADAEAQEMENDATKNANHLYSNAEFVVNPHDSLDLISFNDYEELPDSEKSKYEIKVEGSDKAVPNLFKPGFRSEKGYNAFKDVLRLKNVLQDIKVDDVEQKIRITQARIKQEAENMKLSDPEKKAIIALADLDWQQYRLLMGNANKAAHEGSDEWYKLQKDKDQADIDYKSRLKKKLDDDEEWRKSHDMKSIIQGIIKNGISWENALDAIATLVIAKAGL